MNSFGLGLVLNFVDNASSGMGRATRSFQQMSATADSVASSVSNSVMTMVNASYALDSVGNTLMDTGSSIINLYSNVSQSIIDSGTQMQGYRMQLSALYGSVEAGEAKMKEIKDYAMSSVFDIQSLIPAVTTMKAVGIEAMNDITTSSGKHTQKLLDYASDLAAMNQNMRNSYGTGVNAAMGAFKEYIAEGNALSLKRGAGLDITGILGEDKGATMEERTRQVADLIEHLNIVGYTANLAGTPTQRLSNLQDALFNSLTKIADSGVFEKYCDLLEKLSDWVFSLVEDEESFNAITGVLAETVTSLLEPLENLLDFVIENSNAIIEWIKANPDLVTNILLTVGAVGVLLVVGGALLKLLGSIGMAVAGLSFLKTLPTLIGALGISLLPVISLVGILYGAWSTNMLGIRDLTDKVYKEVSVIFNNLGSVFSILSDALTDNTISEENFKRANDLGILPLISGILQLKYYAGILFDGFKKGFKSVFEGISQFLTGLGLTGINIDDLIQSVKDFFTTITQPGNESTWETIGEIIGKIVAGLVIAIPIISVIVSIVKTVFGFVFGIFSFIGKVFSIVSSVVSFVSSIVSLINSITALMPVLTTVFTGIGSVITSIVSAIPAILSYIAPVLLPVLLAVIAVIGFIASVATAAFSFVMQLIDGFSWFWEIVKWIGIAVAVFILGLTTGLAYLPIAAIIGAIIGIVTLLVVLIKDNWAKISAFLSSVATWIYDNVITPIVEFFRNIVFPIISKIVEIVSKIIEIIVVLVGVAVNIISEWWNGLVEKVSAWVESVKEKLKPFTDWIKVNIIDKVSGFFDWLWEKATTIFKDITDFVGNALKGVLNNAISNIVGRINDVISGINWVIDAINSIPGVSITKITALSVPQLAEGGVVNSPTLAQIGEDGKEAVIPLENNTEWIDKLASKVAPKLISERNRSTTNQPASKEEHNDYSVTFAAGSIVIQLANATDAELEKAAEKLMKIIERKQQLKNMAVRA